jgi:hypothetical protein
MEIGNQVNAQCLDERRRERANWANSEFVGELQTVLGAGQGAEAQNKRGFVIPSTRLADQSVKDRERATDLEANFVRAIIRTGRRRKRPTFKQCELAERRLLGKLKLRPNEWVPKRGFRAVEEGAPMLRGG